MRFHHVKPGRALFVFGKGSMIEEMKEVYVGAIAVPDGAGGAVETIVFGRRQNVMQATVEHTPGAVPALIQLCDEIVKHKGFDYRLLKFDAEGVHVLDPDDYRDYDDFCLLAPWQTPSQGEPGG